jgi:hypothetical protein
MIAILIRPWQLGQQHWVQAAHPGAEGIGKGIDLIQWAADAPTVLPIRAGNR